MTSVVDRAIARQNARRSDARILTIDIETSPMQVWTWQLKTDYIPPDRIIDPGRVLCFAAKWLGSTPVLFHDERNDRGKMIAAAWELFDQADIVIGYNHRRFDVKWLNAEFIQAGYGPPAPYATIDLLAAVRAAFKFPSNKLDYVSQVLELGSKTEHEGWGLWMSCLQGDEAAWRRMKRYNVQDVKLTERLYDELRPWITNHPNLNLYRKERVSGCDKCGAADPVKAGFARLSTGTYQRFRCSACGGYSRATHAEERVYRRGSV